MKTKKLIIDLTAWTIAITFLLLFLPVAFNAANTFLNLLGVYFVVFIVIGAIAVLHGNFTKTNKNNKDEK